MHVLFSANAAGINYCKYIRYLTAGVGFKWEKPAVMLYKVVETWVHCYGRHCEHKYCERKGK